MKTAASLGILCLGIADRSGNADSSAQESVGDDSSGLRGNPFLFDGPGGAGLRRDDRESIAVSGCGVVCVSRNQARCYCRYTLRMEFTTDERRS